MAFTGRLVGTVVLSIFQLRSFNPSTTHVQVGNYCIRAFCFVTSWRCWSTFDTETWEVWWSGASVTRWVRCCFVEWECFSLKCEVKHNLESLLLVLSAFSVSDFLLYLLGAVQRCFHQTARGVCFLWNRVSYNSNELIFQLWQHEADVARGATLGSLTWWVSRM